VPIPSSGLGGAQAGVGREAGRSPSQVRRAKLMSRLIMRLAPRRARAPGADSCGP